MVLSYCCVLHSTPNSQALQSAHLIDCMLHLPDCEPLLLLPICCALVIVPCLLCLITWQALLFLVCLLLWALMVMHSYLLARPCPTPVHASLHFGSHALCSIATFSYKLATPP